VPSNTIDMKKSIFAPGAGHFDIQEKILTSLKQDRLPHAYLFYGPQGSGKEALAIKLAQLLNCERDEFQICNACGQCSKIAAFQHPDVKFVFPTPAESNITDKELMEALQEKAQNPYQRIDFSGKNLFIGIDTIRELKLEARFKLYEGKKKIYIISEADSMRTEAANAILKLLEEPPANLMLILTTSNIYKILPTIKSRCQLMRFRPMAEDQIREIMQQYHPNINSDRLRLIIRLSGHNIKSAFDFLDMDVIAMRETALEFLRKLTLIHRSQELMQIIEPFGRKGSRTEARLVLWFLLLWFQDALHLKNNNGNELLNYDLKDRIEKFIDYAPNVDIQKIVWEIESSIKDLDDVRNFNPVLILTNLAIKLNQRIKP
jgi:DNA polymerase-3 subunit delta'